MYKLAVVVAFALIGLTACDKVSIPEITVEEIGENNSYRGVIGEELHMEAEIKASKKIASIRLVIDMTTADTSSPSVPSDVTGPVQPWSLNKQYTGAYVNVRNTDFHEHVDIPANAQAGTYKLQLIVTDLDGNQGKFEAAIQLVKAS
jgi:hypothetical protein